jgi:hypothetical protein
LPKTPIASTLRVFQTAPDGVTGEEVPRSLVDGFGYYPQSNSLAFFGSYALSTDGPPCASNAECRGAAVCSGGSCADITHVSAHYQTFERPPR